MSTRSNICIRIADKDKNKFRKGHIEELHVMPTGYGYKKFKNNIRQIKVTGDYLCIYHHWNGYPEGVGKSLLEHYNDYKKAFNLCLCGNMSSIVGNQTAPYAANGCELGARDWKDEMPWVCVKGEKPKADFMIEYVYIFEPDAKGNYHWYVTEATYGRKKRLDILLKKLLKEC